MTDKKLIKLVEDTVKELLDLLSIEAEIKIEIAKPDVKENKEEEEKADYKYAKVNIKGEELGALIGFRARNLSSIQYIVGLIINRHLPEKDRGKVRVIIDVNDYRDTRAEKIREITNSKIEELKQSGIDELEMSPMKPEERRVVHLVVKEIKDVQSESVDEGRRRRVKLILKK